MKYNAAKDCYAPSFFPDAATKSKENSPEYILEKTGIQIKFFCKEKRTFFILF